jgi:hypothetical protein
MGIPDGAETDDTHSRRVRVEYPNVGCTAVNNR